MAVRANLWRSSKRSHPQPPGCSAPPFPPTWPAASGSLRSLARSKQLAMRRMLCFDWLPSRANSDNRMLQGSTRIPNILRLKDRQRQEKGSRQTQGKTKQKQLQITQEHAHTQATNKEAAQQAGNQAIDKQAKQSKAIQFKASNTHTHTRQGKPNM